MKLNVEMKNEGYIDLEGCGSDPARGRVSRQPDKVARSDVAGK